MLATAHPGFIERILADSSDETARLVYADWLRDQDEWTWSTVLAHVLAHPEADGLRLLAASWLEENGEPERAEFIRVQCELAKMQEPELKSIIPMPVGQTVITEQEIALYACARCRLLENTCPYHRLYFRERELPHGDRLYLPGATGDYGYITISEWRRGFPYELTLSAAKWLQHADALTAAQPIEAATLTTDLIPGQRHFDDGKGGVAHCYFLSPISSRGNCDRDLKLPWTNGPFPSLEQLLSSEWPTIKFTLPPRARRWDERSASRDFFGNVREAAVPEGAIPYEVR